MSDTPCVGKPRLRLGSSWPTVGAAACAALTSLVLYGLTLVREPDWGDPSELALQASQMGLTQPPSGRAIRSRRGRGDWYQVVFK